MPFVKVDFKNYRNGEQVSGCQELETWWRGRRWVWLQRDNRRNLGGDGSVLYLDYDVKLM